MKAKEDGSDDGDEQLLKMRNRNYGDAFSSEDSEDEDYLERKARRLEKKKEEQARLESSFGKNRSESQATKSEKGELELSNMHAIARRKKQNLLVNMIKKGTSLKKESMSSMSAEEKDLYKGKHETFKKGLIEKIAKHKKDNLKKINKIKIKTKKI